MRSLIGLLPVHRHHGQVPSYCVTDRLHVGRTAQVSADEIAVTVGGWLAELGATSPMVQDLMLAVRCGNWQAAHSLAEHLSVDVVVAA